MSKSNSVQNLPYLVSKFQMVPFDNYLLVMVLNSRSSISFEPTSVCLYIWFHTMRPNMGSSVTYSLSIYFGIFPKVVMIISGTDMLQKVLNLGLAVFHSHDGNTIY